MHELTHYGAKRQCFLKMRPLLRPSSQTAIGGIHWANSGGPLGEVHRLGEIAYDCQMAHAREENYLYTYAGLIGGP
jgi:hypothetical protein